MKKRLLLLAAALLTLGAVTLFSGSASAHNANPESFYIWSAPVLGRHWTSPHT